MRDPASKGKVERYRGRYSAWTSDLYTCVQMHTHIHTLCTQIPVCTHTYVHSPVHVYTHLHTYLCTHTPVRTLLCVYTHTCACNTHVHVQACMRTRAHTHSRLCLLLLGSHSKFRANTSQVCANKIWLQLELPIQHPSKKGGGECSQGEATHLGKKQWFFLPQ